MAIIQGADLERERRVGRRHRWFWAVLVVLVAIPFNLYTFGTVQNGPIASVFYGLVEAAVLFGIWHLIFRYRPNPLTEKKLKRFRSIQRGYWSFITLGALMLVTFFGIGEFFLRMSRTGEATNPVH